MTATRLGQFRPTLARLVGDEWRLALNDCFAQPQPGDWQRQRGMPADRNLSRILVIGDATDHLEPSMTGRWRFQQTADQAFEFDAIVASIMRHEGTTSAELEVTGAVEPRLGA